MPGGARHLFWNPIWLPIKCRGVPGTYFGTPFGFQLSAGGCPAPIWNPIWLPIRCRGVPGTPFWTPFGSGSIHEIFFPTTKKHNGRTSHVVHEASSRAPACRGRTPPGVLSLTCAQTVLHSKICRFAFSKWRPPWGPAVGERETASTGGPFSSYRFYIKVEPPRTGANTDSSRPLRAPTGGKKPGSGH